MSVPPQPPNQWGGPQSPQVVSLLADRRSGDRRLLGSRVGCAWGPQQPYGGPPGQGPGRGARASGSLVALR